ncbi:GerAB/ArcD/ProY family transporter [Metabacillus rhizolycopersici]|uniref:Spore germination protein n=1 Tax=Metabacillus rhizolycopersici TaxID=2875709 RepID=A0ABS7UTT4_9BACI|nr:GerAB/ArcD/ProY family transporter [Metabacillus rhizolycopersici]MBZ5751718.1 spore germination protein [Metabacillus rhizolycopersici]
MLGKYLGWMIGVLYVISLIYIAARTLRSYGDLLLSSTMPKTPLLALNTKNDNFQTCCIALKSSPLVIKADSQTFFVNSGR